MKGNTIMPINFNPFFRMGMAAMRQNGQKPGSLEDVVKTGEQAAKNAVNNNINAPSFTDRMNDGAKEKVDANINAPSFSDGLKNDIGSNIDAPGFWDRNA